jgi:hypothetical protein
MSLRYEIVHRCTDRIFDLESYERTSALHDLMADCDDGFYVVYVDERIAAAIDGVRVVGPFPNAYDAEASACALQRDPIDRRGRA